MSGIFYGIGVGPGDPELMTIKAVRLIRESDVIAVPGETAQESVAYKIARQAVPELAEKQLLAIPMPMTHDREKREENHRRGAERIEKILGQGMDVVFLTLGDPTVYSTFFYLQELVRKDGYPTEVVSGVPSFCAAAARAQMPLVMWNEPLFVVPAAHSGTRKHGLSGTFGGSRAAEETHGSGEEALAACGEKTARAGGTLVYMKSGKKLRQLKDAAQAEGREMVFLENCGMEHEKICRDPEEIPDEAGYYSLLIVK